MMVNCRCPAALANYDTPPTLTLPPPGWRIIWSNLTYAVKTDRPPLKLFWIHLGSQWALLLLGCTHFFTVNVDAIQKVSVRCYTSSRQTTLYYVNASILQCCPLKCYNKIFVWGVLTSAKYCYVCTDNGILACIMCPEVDAAAQVLNKLLDSEVNLTTTLRPAFWMWTSKSDILVCVFGVSSPQQSVNPRLIYCENTRKCSNYPSCIQIISKLEGRPFSSRAL